MISNIFVASGSQPSRDELGMIVGNTAVNPFISLDLPFIPTLYSFSVFAFVFDEEKDVSDIESVAFEVFNPKNKSVSRLDLNTSIPKEDEPATTLNFAFSIENVKFDMPGIYTIKFFLEGQEINETQFNVFDKKEGQDGN